MSRKKRTGKRTVADYRALAKEVRAFTTTDYSKKRKLTPQDKAAITRAARVLSEGTFIPVRRKPKESARDYERRLQKLRSTEYASGNRTLRGIVKALPEGAEKARIEGGRIKYELPPIKSKKHGRPRKSYTQRTGYRIRLRKDHDHDEWQEGEASARPITERARDAIRMEIHEALRGQRRPVEIFMGVGQRLNCKRTFVLPEADDDLIEELLDEVEFRISKYEIQGYLQITARSG